MRSPNRNRTAVLVTSGVVLSVASAWLVTSFLAPDDAGIGLADLSPPVTPISSGPEVSHADLERGRVYYIQVCVPCHGGRGDGMGEWAYRINPQPADLTAARTQARSDADLYRIVTDGIPGTAMIGWDRRLSDAQRRQVVAYVRYLAGTRGVDRE